jgi:predicted small lipoprotein YifL
VVFGLVFAACATTVAGCGKRGGLEAPRRADEPLDEDGRRLPANAHRPRKAPRNDFFLDPLL